MVKSVPMFSGSLGNIGPVWRPACLVLVAGVVLLFCGACSPWSSVGIGADSIDLGDTVTQVREKMGGDGRKSESDINSTEGATVMNFTWTYDEVQLYFHMNEVVEIRRQDPETGIWVRTRPPLPPRETPQPPGQTVSPGRTVPGINPARP